MLGLIKMSQQFNDELTEKAVDVSKTPIVQGWYYDQILTTEYRYWLLTAYLGAGVLGVLGCWLTIVFFQWLSGPTVGNF